MTDRVKWGHEPVSETRGRAARCIRVAIACFLVGILASIAIAWGLAAIARHDFEDESFFSSATAPAWYGSRVHRFGRLTISMMLVCDPGFVEPDVASFAWEVAVLPRQWRAEGARRMDMGVQGDLLWIDESGWPLRCMGGGCRERDTDGDGDRDHIEFFGAVELAPGVNNLIERRILPFRPLWPGLILDGLFWSPGLVCDV